MHGASRSQPTPEARDRARDRLRRITAWTGAGAAGAVAVLSAVAAWTLPGVSGSTPAASNSSPTAGDAVPSAGSSTSQSQAPAVQPAQIPQPIQVQPAAPQQAAPSGRVHAVTGATH